MADGEKTTLGSASQISETLIPSQQITLTTLLDQLGNSGVYVVNGFLEGDYNQDLAGKVGLETYDRMRKSDATVSTLLNVIGLPIRSTEWYIEPGKNEAGDVTEAEEEIAKFVHRAFFEKMEQGWDDHLREVLTCLWSGYAVFEKVLMQEDEHTWIKRLAFRKQKTILRWAQTDGSAGITQITPTPVKQKDGSVQYWIDIPASKLLIFTYQREGDNYEGISLLRAAYKHWYIKDNLYKFESVRHERQAVGIPFMKLPVGSSTDDYAQAKAILMNLRANELTGVVLPNPAWEIGFMDMRANDVSNVETTIAHHNREILKVGLAQFLDLGGGSKGSSGSRAVSSDQSGLMLQAIDAVARMLDDVYSRFMIPELVDLNFDNIYRYPLLRHKRLEKLDTNVLGTMLQQLSAAGFITPDDETEEYLRTVLDLPPKIDKTQRDTPDMPEEDIPEEEVPEDNDESTADAVGTTQQNVAAMPQAQQDAQEAGGDMPEDEQGNDGAMASEHPIFKDIPLYSFQGTLFGEYAGEFYPHDGVQFRAPVSDETKKKISDSLKAKYGTTGMTPQEVAARSRGAAGAKGQVTNIAQKAAQVKTAARAGNIQQKGVSAVNQNRGTRGTGTADHPSAEALQKLGAGATPPASPDAAAGTPAASTSSTKSTPASKAAAASAKASAKATAAASKAQAKATKQADSAKAKSAKAEAKSQKAALNPKGDAHQKLQALRSLASSSKDPTMKARAQQALKDAQTKLAPKMAKQTASANKKQASTNKKAAAAAKKAAKAAAPKKAKGSKGGKGKKGTATPAQIAQTLKNYGLHEHRHGIRFSEHYDRRAVMRTQWESMPIEFSEAQLPPERRRKQFAEKFKAFKSWRPLTFAEQKVNLASLAAAIDQANAATKVKLDEIATQMKADLLTQVKNAVKAGDITAVGKLKTKFTGDLSSALTDVQKQMFERGMQSASSELGLEVPPTAAGVKGVMRVQNDKLTQGLAGDMADAASNAVTQLAGKNAGSLDNTGVAEAVSAAGQAIDSVMEQTAAMRTLSVIGSLNLGRSTVFERYPEQVYAFQFSAIIDNKTTDLCLSLDGRVVDAGSDDYYSFSPPQHENCRSIWVEILQDEEFKPDIGGIPSSITPNTDLSQFEDLEAPIVEANSPAIKVLQQELTDRQDKLDQYKTAGVYQNRQDAHSDRITALKAALKSAGAEIPEDDGE